MKVYFRNIIWTAAVVLGAALLAGCDGENPLTPTNDTTTNTHQLTQDVSQNVNINIGNGVQPAPPTRTAPVTPTPTPAPVDPVQPNNAPVLINPGPLESVAGVAVTFGVEAEDADGDSLTFTMTGGPRGLEIDSGTGVISGEPSPSSPEDSPFTTTVTVSDGEASDSVTFDWFILAAPEVL